MTLLDASEVGRVSATAVAIKKSLDPDQRRILGLMLEPGASAASVAKALQKRERGITDRSVEFRFGIMCKSIGAQGTDLALLRKAWAVYNAAEEAAGDDDDFVWTPERVEEIAAKTSVPESEEPAITPINDADPAVEEPETHDAVTEIVTDEAPRIEESQETPPTPERALTPLGAEEGSGTETAAMPDAKNGVADDAFEIPAFLKRQTAPQPRIGGTESFLKRGEQIPDDLVQSGGIVRLRNPGNIVDLVLLVEEAKGAAEDARKLHAWGLFSEGIVRLPESGYHVQVFVRRE